jgi:signal transduction histidine kinase
LPNLDGTAPERYDMNVFRVVSGKVVGKSPLRRLSASVWRSSRRLSSQPGYRWSPASGEPPVAATGPHMEPARDISQRLVAVQETVRRDMADYLHGHVQSKLLALSMSLSACRQILARDPAHAYHLLERVQEELQRVQDEDLRQVSRELYPAIIKMGLVPALRSLVSRFSDLLEIELVIDAGTSALDAAGESQLPEKQRLGIYRIAEEALNNALKHARARRVEVVLVCRESQWLTLLISDDGCGFDPRMVPVSQGLIMMSDYAAAIGGQAEINSSVGHGCTVRLALPLGVPRAGEAMAAGAARPSLSFSP